MALRVDHPQNFSTTDNDQSRRRQKIVAVSDLFRARCPPSWHARSSEGPNNLKNRMIITDAEISAIARRIFVSLLARGGGSGGDGGNFVARMRKMVDVEAGCLFAAWHSSSKHARHESKGIRGGIIAGRGSSCDSSTTFYRIGGMEALIALILGRTVGFLVHGSAEQRANATEYLKMTVGGPLSQVMDDDERDTVCAMVMASLIDCGAPQAAIDILGRFDVRVGKMSRRVRAANIEALLRLGRFIDVTILLSESCDARDFDAALDVLSELGDGCSAMRIVDLMDTLGVAWTPATSVRLVGALVRGSMMDEAIAVARKLEQDLGRPPIAALHWLLHGHLATPRAIPKGSSQVERRPPNFRAAAEVYVWIKRLGLDNITTRIIILHGIALAGELEATEAVLFTFDDATSDERAATAYNITLKATADGLKHNNPQALSSMHALLSRFNKQRRSSSSPHILTTMIHAHAAAGSPLPTSLALFSSMTEDGVAPDTAAYNSLLHACARASNPFVAVAVFNELATRCRTARPDKISFTTLITALTTGDGRRSPRGCPRIHIDGVQSFQATAIGCLDAAIASGVTPDVIMIGAAMSCVSRWRGLDAVAGAARVWDRMERSGVRPNARMIGSMLHACRTADEEHVVGILSMLLKDGHGLAMERDGLVRLTLETMGVRIWYEEGHRRKFRHEDDDDDDDEGKESQSSETSGGRWVLALASGRTVEIPL